MKRVLTITWSAHAAPKLLETNELMASLNDESTDMAFAACTVQELLFSVHDTTTSITLHGSELHTMCDVIHLRNTNLFPDYANAIRLYADHYGIWIVNRADAVLPYYGKVSQGFLMAANAIRTPSFVSSCSNGTLMNALKQTVQDFPIVIKHNDATMGHHNYLVHDLAEAGSILMKEKQGFLAQRFIANDGELRILQFGDLVEPLIFKKQAAEGMYLNNTSQGGSSTPVAREDVDPEILRQALRASQLMGREVAGIDVLLAKDGQFYILEVNITPAISSGVMLAEKRELYASFFRQLKEKEA